MEGAGSATATTAAAAVADRDWDWVCIGLDDAADLKMPGNPFFSNLWLWVFLDPFLINFLG